MNNGPDLGNVIHNSEKSNLHVDFKRTVRDSQQNSRCISKWRPPVVVNAHPENQTKFSKVPIFTGDKSYRNKNSEQKNIFISSDNIPSRIKT